MCEEINTGSKDERSDKTQAGECLTGTVRHLIATGRVNCRDDIIRHLCGGGFDIVGVTADSITLCAPDEPEEMLTLSGYCFSERFSLRVPEAVGKPAGTAPPYRPVTARIRRSKVIADGILLSHTAGLAKWGLFCVLVWILTGHGWLPSGLLTDEVQPVLTGVSAVAAVCLAAVSVFSLVADLVMIRVRKWQDRRRVSGECTGNGCPEWLEGGKS